VLSLTRLRLGIGADDVGEELKRLLMFLLQDHPRHVSLDDYSYADTALYPTVAIGVAEAIRRGDIDRAVLICGTGIGMCIAANKVPGVRAAVGHDSYSVERSIKSNNCQVLALGSRIVAPTLAYRLVDEWLRYDFDIGTPSDTKLQLLDEFEQRQIDHEDKNPGGPVSSLGARATGFRT